MFFAMIKKINRLKRFVLIVIILGILAFNSMSSRILAKDYDVSFDYGRGIFSFWVFTQVQDPDKTDNEGHMHNLANAGDYKFDQITINKYRLYARYKMCSYTYQKETNHQQVTEKWDDLGYVERRLSGYIPLYDKITQILGCTFRNVEKEEEDDYYSVFDMFFDNTNFLQLTYQKFLFRGDYNRENVFVENFLFDKTKYGIKLLTDRKREYAHQKNCYHQISFESSEFPQIIYVEESSYRKYSDLDPKFHSNKYSYLYGHDYGNSEHDPHHLFLGWKVGIGLSDIEMSDEAKRRAKDAGFNIDNSVTPHLIAGLKLGYSFEKTIKGLSISAGIMGDTELIREFSYDISHSGSDSNVDDLIYQRNEILGKVYLFFGLRF